MGISNPRLSVPRDPPVWCEAETGSAANITPELPAEQEKALSKHGRRRAVINPRPRMVGRSGRLGAATRVVPQRFIFRLCLLWETKAIFLTGENQLPASTVGRIATAGVRTGFAMTGYKECGRTGRRGRRPLRTGTRCAVERATARVAPTEGYKECGEAGRCGERTERCRWQRKRSERVAAVKILSVRRKAAQKFWAPQQGHRPLRTVYR